MAVLTTPTRPWDRYKDHVIDQGWGDYSEEDHATWRTLFERQSNILPGRACEEFLEGLERLGVAAEGIPEFARLSDILEQATGWRIVAVPGLVPDDVFFRHLANRRFPATNWIRRPEQMDYLQEPDVFHDVFGHVPLLVNSIFADYLWAYGRNGLEAMRRGALKRVARLYWYTVEFGLIRTAEGLRIYGSGIVSSRSESVYCLEGDKPNRVAFEPGRVMRTNYRIDDFQEIYFVIDSFERLFEQTTGDLATVYERLTGTRDLAPGDVLAEDRLVEL